MSKYEWLLFDADGTLFDFDAAQEHAIEKMFGSAGIAFKAEYHIIYKDINKKIWDMFERGQITQKELPVLRFKLFFEIISVKANPETASKDYLKFLSEGHELLDGAESLIEQIAAEFKLVLITNGLKSVQRPRFSNSPITKFFEHIIISEEVGYAKPNSAIFDLTFKKMGNPQKEKTMIIGDNPGSDILGGMNYSIDTCWYNPHKFAAPAEISPTYEVKSFDQLISILK